MTPRQRVMQTIRHEQPDRPPIFATLTPQVAEMLGKHMNMDPGRPIDSLLSTRISHAELLTSLGNDCVGIAAGVPSDNPTCEEPDGTLMNEWGIRLKPIGHYAEFIEHPLVNAESVKDLDQFPWPDPHAPGRYDAAEQIVKKYGDKYAVVGDLECSMFEMSWYLVGFDKFLMGLSTREPYILEIMDRVLSYTISVGKKLIELGADIIWAGDDYGTQRGMLISPDMWRELMKPRIRIMFNEFRRINPNIKLAWHSCGSILPIITDFIELGLDILNPLQPNAYGMEPQFLKDTYGDHLCFFGGVDVQQLLPFGTVEEVKNEVARRIRILGRNGGYIVAPAHNIQPDTSVENILAMYETVLNWGKA
jgi:uroporphyrinogen decarboxylase